MHDTKLHFVDDKIILEVRTLVCSLNAKTGKMLWKIGDETGLFVCDGQTTYHDGVLYGAFGYVGAINCDTGERLRTAKNLEIFLWKV